MADHQKILDVLYDYGWGNDTSDLATLRSVFTEDARFALSIVGVEESYGPFEGREAIVEFLAATLDAQSDFQLRHVFANVRFLEETDDTAKVRAYLVFYLVDQGALTAKSCGFYLLEFASREGDWKIADLNLALDLPF